MRIKPQMMIKEALDNLPVGVCFFDGNGVPLLINRTMHKVVYALNRRDLQSFSELEHILERPDEVMSGDGKIWRFRERKIAEDVTEITAADITELYRKKRELMRSNAEQRRIMEQLERLGRNVVSITRSEEILSLKMKIHNDLGYAISSTRRFIGGNFTAEEKREFINRQREMARILLNETTGSDEPDVFTELRSSAEKLGMKIVFEGELPESAKNIMTKIVRESLINAVRHAGGDKVFVSSEVSGDLYTARITNNGAPPGGEITEGGGLSTLRKSIESAGGKMTVSVDPEFELTVELPVQRGENND